MKPEYDRAGAAWRWLLLLYLNHRHRDARDADQAILFIDDADLPDVTALADVNRASRADDVSTRNRAYMIRVDLLADGAVLLRIDHQASSDAA
jgi:hypothetical protein